jgi:hypothetical protein
VADSKTIPTDLISMEREADLQAWAKKFDTTPEQIREAVGAVGAKAADVEMYLKGSHATTDADLQATADRTTGQA